MVLISHKYKFIYIKNRKTAGSSVESFFGQFCIGKQVSRETASLIKKDLGENKFNKYLKFCVVRNPYDKMVSWYYDRRTDLNFKQFVKSTDVNDFNLFSIDGNNVCDYIIRYENLEDDIIKLCNKLGIKNYNINNLPKHKSHLRKDKSHYSKFYEDEETKNIVYNKHKKEFELFGYKFEKK